jgi:hypothetical protein
MHPSFRALAALSAISFLSCAQVASAAIGASGDASKPSQSTSYNRFGGGGGGGGNFQVVEGVALDPLAGPWQKSLVNNGPGGVASGVDVAITEILTNVGAVPWTDWHENVVSRTTIFAPNDSPGFLFRQGSLTLSADYGAGFVPLTQGTDYTLVTTPNSGPPDPSGNDANWEAIDIFFNPSANIGPGNTLRIDKSIFEVFLDGNVWQNGEAAVIAEFPSAVPEPAAVAICAGALMAIAQRRKSA